MSEEMHEMPTREEVRERLADDIPTFYCWMCRGRFYVPAWGIHSLHHTSMKDVTRPENDTTLREVENEDS